MKKIAECLCFFGLLGFLALPVEAATHGKKPAASASAKHTTAKKTSSADKGKSKKSATTGSSKAGSGKARSAASGKSSSTERSCRTVKGRKGKSRSVCTTTATKAAAVADQTPTLRSPIRENALDDNPPPSADKSGEIKARTVPDHAYAVDGETFFYQGKKYRISGMSGTGGSDMDKQRLQKALDAGALNVETVGTDDAGMSVANVTVNGQNLRDQLR